MQIDTNTAQITHNPPTLAENTPSPPAPSVVEQFRQEEEGAEEAARAYARAYLGQHGETPAPPTLAENTPFPQIHHTHLYLQTLIDIQSFNFKENISADFKAWICSIHPLYITKYTRMKKDLHTFKIKYNYDTLKNDKQAPWNLFVKNIPTLIQTIQKKLNTPIQNTDDSSLVRADNTDTLKLKYHTLQNEYDTLKQQYTRLKLSNTLLNKNALLREHKLRIVQNNSNELVLKFNTLRTSNIEIAELLRNTQDSMYYHVQKYRTTKKQVEDLKQEKTLIMNSFLQFQPQQLSQNALDLLQDKYSTPTPIMEKLSLICPITKDIFIEPVIALDGRTYEKTAIEYWFKDNHKSPETGEQLSSTILIPNMFARILIDELHNLN